MSVRKQLPFRQVNELALGQYPDLLFQWFPAGQLVDGKREFAIGSLDGTPGGKDGGSVKVKISTGEWAEMNGGEPKGNDPVSLYAWAKCGGDMGRACKEMGAALGIYDGPLPRGNKVVPFPVKNPPKAAPPKEEWISQVPPEGAPVPVAELAKWDHVFHYLDREGRLTRYVLRTDAKGLEAKLIRPLTY